jgi:predicted Zn-dependent protease
MPALSTVNRLVSILVIAALAMAWMPAAAQQRPTFIRDAETEMALAKFAEPILGAAGLDSAAVRIYLIKDNRINAFVAGGQNLFFHTGLIYAAEHAEQLIGVIAHEVGHIAGGHLPRLKEAQRMATLEQLLFCILGVGAAGAGGAAGGGGNVGAAATLCGSNVGIGSLTKFSRTQESAADYAGMGYLDATGQSSRGMLEFLQILARQQKIALLPPAYLSTHPLSEDRMEAVRAHLGRSPYSNQPPRADFEAGFQRIRAKLIGYVDPLPRVLQRFPASDNSLEARYGRAMAYYEAGQLPQAQAEIDSLLADYPRDPFFNEMKGDMYYRSGKIAQALPYYEAAVAAEPNSALLRLVLARAQVDSREPRQVNAAIGHLQEVVRLEPRNPGAWRTMGIAYGLNKNEPEASLALAESAVNSGDRARARQLAERAMKGLPAGSPGWLRAQDIANVVDPAEE